VVRNKSVISEEVRSLKRGTGRRGQMRMWPGRRGLRFTRAKVRGVMWKTWIYIISQSADFEL